MSFTWSSTLLKYLSLSNEDCQIERFVRSTIFSILESLGPEIRWLEVGSGPGTKTDAIAGAFDKSEVLRLCSLHLVEPDPIWNEFVRQHNPNLFKIGELYETLFEDYARERSYTNKQSQPNFITSFHVLYYPELIDSFLRYAKNLQRANSQALVSIVVEDEASDLFLLRRELPQLDISLPIPSILYLRDSLENLGLSAVEYPINGQYFKIPDEEGSTQWLLAFLLGCEPKALLDIGEKERSEATTVIDRYINDKSDRTLCVPDVGVTIMI